MWAKLFDIPRKTTQYTTYFASCSMGTIKTAWLCYKMEGVRLAPCRSATAPQKKEDTIPYFGKLLKSYITNAGNRMHQNNYNVFPPHYSMTVLLGREHLHDPNRKVSAEPRQSSYCHLLAEKGTQSPLVYYSVWTYTSESSFLFFSSFFSFSSSWVMSPFFTRSSFSLTWSSIFSTWGPTHNHTPLFKVGTADNKSHDNR